MNREATGAATVSMEPVRQCAAWHKSSVGQLRASNLLPLNVRRSVFWHDFRFSLTHFNSQARVRVRFRPNPCEFARLYVRFRQQAAWKCGPRNPTGYPYFDLQVF